MIGELLSQAFPLGDAAIYALIGFIFVFCGIALLILIFTLLGAVMKRVNARPKKEKKSKKAKGNAANTQSMERAEERTEIPVGTDGEIPPEVVAAITAAVVCCMQQLSPKCEFRVKRIRKL